MSAIWGSLILRRLSLASGSVMKQLKLDSEVSSYLMATVNVVFLQLKLENHNLASWVQPFDQGIICSFKGIYCKFHVRWILDMLDSQVFRNASQARVDVRTAIEWTRTAWDDLSANLKTVKNCWNHAKILPGSACCCSRYRTKRCCTEGACYSAAASAGSWNAGWRRCGCNRDGAASSERCQWTAAPIESEDEDAEWRAAIQNTEADEQDADVSEHVVPLTLREARVAAHALKIFVQENQSIEAFRRFLVQFERFSR